MARVRSAWMLAAAVAVSGVVVAGALWLATDARARTVRRLPTAERVVALTFDDGPDPRYTPQVLGILRDEGVRATFFLVGQKVEACGDAVDYEGFLVGDHTYSHPSMLLLTPAKQIREFERGEAAIEALHGPVRFYRGPRGQAWPAAVRWADRRGTYLLWSVSYDKVIRSRRGSARVLDHHERVAAFVSAVRPGDIVLMHDGNGNARYLAEDLRAIIRALRAQGYRFVTPDELAGLKGR